MGQIMSSTVFLAKLRRIMEVGRKDQREKKQSQQYDRNRDSSTILNGFANNNTVTYM